MQAVIAFVDSSEAFISKLMKILSIYQLKVPTKIEEATNILNRYTVAQVFLDVVAAIL